MEVASFEYTVVAFVYVLFRRTYVAQHVTVQVVFAALLIQGCGSSCSVQ